MPARRPTGPVLPDDGAGFEALAATSFQDGDEWIEVVAGGDLTGVTAHRVDITSSILRGVRLTGAELPHLRVRDAVLEDCELSGTLLEEVLMTRVELRRCRLTGAVLSGGQLRDVVVDGCHLDDAALRRMTWERVEVRGSRLQRADLYGTRLPAAALLDCDLTGATLSGAAMAGVRLHGSTLTDLVGADALRGAVIGPEMAVPVGLALLAHAGVVVADPEPEGQGRRR